MRKRYRFVRIKWQSDEMITETVNRLCKPDEEVLTMAVIGSEVCILFVTK